MSVVTTEGILTVQIIHKEAVWLTRGEKGKDLDSKLYSSINLFKSKLKAATLFLERNKNDNNSITLIISTVIPTELTLKQIVLLGLKTNWK